MRLTPLDIKKQDFKRVMRGVDPEEVQAFLNMVADQWQEVSDEHSRREHKITELETKLLHYKEVEEALQEAVKTARESSRQTLEAAKQKAQSIVDAAAETAERIHNKAHEDRYELKRDIQSLQSQRTEIIARLKNVLRTELEILGEFDRQFPVPVQAEVEILAEDLGPTIKPVESFEDEEEREAIEDMVELDARSSEEIAIEAQGEPEVESDDLAHKDALVFTAEEAVVEPDASAETPQPAARRESQRDSAEMDKIRKILDDLA